MIKKRTRQEILVENLNRIFLEKKTNPYKLANKSNGRISHVSVSRWLKGKRYPTPDNVELLAELLEVSTYELTEDMFDDNYIEYLNIRKNTEHIVNDNQDLFSDNHYFPILSDIDNYLLNQILIEQTKKLIHLLPLSEEDKDHSFRTIFSELKSYVFMYSRFELNIDVRMESFDDDTIGRINKQVKDYKTFLIEQEKNNKNHGNL